MEKAWVIKDADQYFYRFGLRRATKGLPFADEKNPARAYTFSLFFWGAGQSYNGERMKSVLFQTFMIVFLAAIVISLVYGKDLLTLLLASGISHSDLFLSGEFLLFGASIFWTYNAIDAYHGAAKARRVPFRGVQSRALPMLSSLLIPGWGQFMNGQPVKGTFLAIFSVLGIFSLVSLPAVLLCWPSLEPSPVRSIIEAIFAATVLYAPLIPIISLFSSYDALRVSADDVKKESVLDRLMLAINRLQLQGWVRSIFPLIKIMIVLALLITFLITAINYNYIPTERMYDSIMRVQGWLYKQGMTLVPDLIGMLLSGRAF